MLNCLNLVNKQGFGFWKVERLINWVSSKFNVVCSVRVRSNTNSYLGMHIVSVCYLHSYIYNNDYLRIRLPLKCTGQTDIYFFLNMDRGP